MTTTTRSVSALGLALITLAGTTAGFLAGALPAARGTPDVGPIEPGQARLVDPAPDAIEVASAGDGDAQLLVFDANTTFQRSVSVEADEEERVELALEAAIVLVPATSAPAELGLPSDDVEVEPVATRTQPHLLVNASGPVDERARVTLDERPASLALAVEGDAERLQARLTTERGVVLERGTSPGTDSRLEPGNLTDGLYRAEIQADELEGTLQLVTRTLAPDRPLEALGAPEGVHELGTPLARVEPGEAWRVPAEEVDELRLGLEEGGEADVRVYGPEDRVLQHVELGEEGPDWRWSGNGSGPPTYEATPVDASRDVYTVYVHDARADTDATVYVLASEDAEVEPGHQLSIETSTVSVSYPSPSGTESERVRYPGGLVDLHVEEADGAAAERRITVDSPTGIVLDHHAQAAGGNTDVAGDQVKNVDRFGPGPVEIVVEADAASGAVHLALTHYSPETP